MIYDLIILTTAIDRPDLHNQTLRPFFDMLEKQGIDHKWIVNLDSPFNKREAALNNLKTFNYSYHGHDIHMSNKACFYSAAKHVITAAYDDLVDLDGYVMWLEDDWDLLVPFNMRELIDSDYEYIGFHFHHFFEFSFNPTIWSQDFFVKNVYEPFASSEESIDPEQLLINHHKKTRAEDPSHLKNVNRINFNGVFEDAGRKWGEQYNLKKWNKNKTGGSVSYV
jgi:hypothetical protein